MIAAANERELSAVALQIIGSRRSLTVAERKIATTETPASADKVDALKDAIRAGVDLLGAEFQRLRSPEIRRARGAVYTPPAIVEAMIDWAKAEDGDAPARIVDPGCGSGRFLMAAAAAFPKAALVAVEIDPLAALLLRANAAAAGFADRLMVYLGDYLTVKLPKIEGRTLFIGNPPYVRHHQIANEAKTWFGETASRLGFRASKLAGLHVYFFLRTRQLARAGDFGAFITSSEWMDVNYGSVLRTSLPSLTSLKEKLIKIGAKVVSHGRYVAFQMAEVAIPRNLDAFGVHGVAELCYLVGLYCLVSVTLNGFDVPVPEPEEGPV